MNSRLVFPRNWFEQMLLQLAENPQTEFYYPIGIHYEAKQTSYLVQNRPVRSIQSMSTPRVLYVCTTNQVFSSQNFRAPHSSQISAYFVLGREELLGQWWAMHKDSQENFVPIHELALGSELSSLQNSISSPSISNNILTSREVWQRWSRTIEALGDQHWRRLHQLSATIIGCGRSGSSLAVTLTRLGIGRLLLVDPDKVESHNLPEMDGVNESDLGRGKVEALADFLKKNCSASILPIQIVAYEKPLREIYREALSTDLLISCVDNDTARLSCGLLATLFHKTLLDIGTGVLPQPNSSFPEMGADIRLILPGQPCLLCSGGVVRYEEALNVLANNAPEKPQIWWRNRSGSLRSLNMLAVHWGVQLLIEWLMGQIKQSQWLHLQREQKWEIETISPSFQKNCLLCPKAGLGEDGIHWK